MTKPSLSAWQWGLYDFANSLANVAVSFYFALWFVENFRGSEGSIGIAVAVVTVLLLLTLPQIGAHADNRGSHASLLTHLTFGSVIALSLLGIVTLVVSESSLGATLVVLGLYGLFQYIYQSSVSIYTSLLRFVSKAGSNEEVRISGIGNAMGQLGNVVGVLIALPIASMFGRPAAFLSGAALFFLCSIPALKWIRRLNTTHATPPAPVTLIGAWQDIHRAPNVLNYLIGYYLFSDAVLTLQLFLTLYLTVVAQLSDSAKTMLMAGGLCAAVTGAMLAKYIAKKIPVKKAIEISILLWAMLLVAFAVVTHSALFIIITLLNGFAFGVLFSLSQAYYSTLVPLEHQARYFGIYTVFERASSLLGPLLWSAVIIAFADFGAWRYRFAVLSLAFLVFISLAFIRRVKDPIIT